MDTTDNYKREIKLQILDFQDRNLRISFLEKETLKLKKFLQDLEQSLSNYYNQKDVTTVEVYNNIEKFFTARIEKGTIHISDPNPSPKDGAFGFVEKRTEKALTYNYNSQYFLTDKQKQIIFDYILEKYRDQYEGINIKN